MSSMLLLLYSLLIDSFVCFLYNIIQQLELKTWIFPAKKIFIFRPLNFFSKKWHIYWLIWRQYNILTLAFCTYSFSQSDDNFRYMRSKYYKMKNKYWTNFGIFNFNFRHFQCLTDNTEFICRRCFIPWMKG